MLLLLYSYTRDTPASADDFSGRTVGGSSRNGLSNHVWPEIPVSSHLSPSPSPFLMERMERQYPTGRSSKKCDRSQNPWTPRGLAHLTC